MARNRNNGYAGLPAILLAGAFLLPLLSRAVAWLRWPDEFRVLVPVLLGAFLLATARPWRLERLRRGGREQDDPALAGVDDLEP